MNGDYESNWSQQDQNFTSRPGRKKLQSAARECRVLMLLALLTALSDGRSKHSFTVQVLS